MSPAGAWTAYQVLRSDVRIGYWPEPRSLAEIWERFTKGKLSSPNLWTDAYLSAFAEAGGFTLVTFDKRVPMREGLHCLVLGGIPER